MGKIGFIYSRIQQFKRQYQFLYFVSLMLFFWALFDGVVSYILPIKITQAGFSDTMLGIIIGSSSVAGAGFDFLLSKFLKQTHFRRIYLFMFAISFIFSFILWQSHTLFLFFVAMSLWGLYYDLENFGNFDFVGRKSEESNHSSFFGIMLITKDLGYTLAPIFTGLLLGAIIDIKPFLLMWFFLGVSFIFFLGLIFATKKGENDFLPNISHKPLHALVELYLWKKLGKIILPILLLTVMLNIFDSFFWTLGPLIAESFTSLRPFNGIFLAMYTLQPLFTGWFVKHLTTRFGKKKTAFYCFIVGSGVLSLFDLMQLPAIILGGIFLASLFVSFSSPSINGAYTDYIFEAPKMQKEIEALEDLSCNIGYFIGPIMAGFLADRLGKGITFSILGILGVLVGFILMSITPKKITIPT